MAHIAPLLLKNTRKLSAVCISQSFSTSVKIHTLHFQATQSALDLADSSLTWTGSWTSMNWTCDVLSVQLPNDNISRQDVKCCSELAYRVALQRNSRSKLLPLMYTRISMCSAFRTIHYVHDPNKSSVSMVQHGMCCLEHSPQDRLDVIGACLETVL